MKPLILILLTAIAVQAQSLADVARQERARQAQLKSIRVYTSNDAQGSAEEKPAPATKPAPPIVPIPTDPVQQWNDKVQKLRAAVQNLQDQETAAQLQINDLSNQVFAPISDPATQAQAQSNLTAAQSKLSGIREELAKARTSLQEMETQGPPKK